MTMTDPIADLLTRVRNALLEKHEEVEVPASRLKAHIVHVLKREGYIKNFRFIRERHYAKIRIYLKYREDGASVIRVIRRISTPGRRVYAGYKNLPRPLRGAGVAIVSTPQGVLTANRARVQKVGGEVLCEVQ